MNLLANEFDLLSGFIKSNTGIELTQEKIYLIEHRFGPLVKSLDCSSFTALHDKAAVDYAVKQAMVNAITTNETLFFRDKTPFKLLTDFIVPTLEKSSPGNFSILSAACSSGQEALSMCIALRESQRDLDRYSIIGADISEEILEKAREANYSQFELNRGLSQQQQDKYFTAAGNGFKPIEDIRRCTSFKSTNLLDKAAFSPSYDVIFCRNIACYFNAATKQQLFENLAAQLKPHGFLVVGSTESLDGFVDLFEVRYFEEAKYYILKSNSLS